MSQLHPETGEICQHETGTTEHSAEHEEAVAAQLGRCPVPRGAIVSVIDVEVPGTKHQGSAEHERWKRPKISSLPGLGPIPSGIV